MRPPSATAIRFVFTLGIIATASACFVFRGVRTASLAATPDTVIVDTPVKVHLRDGETVVFGNGMVLAHDTVRGSGRRFELADSLWGQGRDATVVPMDSVAAMESFKAYTKVGPTISVSTLGTVVGAAAAVGLYVAIFGSCPTIYSDSAGTSRLEAEGFPYSIAPIMERRDLHRLRAQPDASGVVALEVRNEALETHYLNHLELLGITHARDEFVLPDVSNRPLAVRRIAPVRHAVDRAGNDVTSELSSDDSLVFHTDARTVADAGAADLYDWIDLSLPSPAASDSVALLFTVRNSLLNTVLLYDAMLRSQGAGAVDFVGRDLGTISRAVKLGRWFGSRMGMHIAVWRNGAWDTVAHVPDAGPIAWRQVAAVIPVPPGDTLHVRLIFVADQWRIGRVAVADSFRRPRPERIPLHSVLRANGTSDSAALANMREPDDRYLTTFPGQRFTARFATGANPTDSSRTFLLATEGYYIEWIRGDWVRQAHDTHPFVASDSTLAATLRHWAVVHTEFERRFETTRIPVR